MMSSAFHSSYCSTARPHEKKDASKTFFFMPRTFIYKLMLPYSSAKAFHLRRVVKHIESTPNLPSGIDHATIRSYVYGLTDKMALHYAKYGYSEAFDKLFRIRDRIVKNKRLRMVWVLIPRLLRWVLESMRIRRAFDRHRVGRKRLTLEVNTQSRDFGHVTPVLQQVYRCAQKSWERLGYTCTRRRHTHYPRNQHAKDPTFFHIMHNMHAAGI